MKVIDLKESGRLVLPLLLISVRDLGNFSKQCVQMGLVEQVGCPSPSAKGGRSVRRRRTAIAAGGLGAA